MQLRAASGCRLSPPFPPPVPCATDFSKRFTAKFEEIAAHQNFDHKIDSQVVKMAAMSRLPDFGARTETFSKKELTADTRHHGTRHGLCRRLSFGKMPELLGGAVQRGACSGNC